jgi:acetyltransferase
MAQRLHTLRPEARLAGFTVQQMARRPSAHELIVGAATDAVFGPVILFGRGGLAVEVIADRAVTLPPLNMNLARELVSRTRVSRLLKGYRDRPPAKLEAVLLTLIQVSQMVIDLPEVTEIDVNPLLADPAGVLALDARVSIEAAPGTASERLAIRPYPSELEETVTLPDGRSVLLRPIRPEDEPAHYEFFTELEEEDVRFRFFGLIRRVSHSQLARYTQIDYDREMAFIARPAEPAERAETHSQLARYTQIDYDREMAFIARPAEPAERAETLGVVRAIADPDNTRAEFAIVVRSDLKGRGIGHALLDKMIRYCRSKRTPELVGQVLPDNRPMLSLAESFGFSSQLLPENGAVELRLKL